MKRKAHHLHHPHTRVRPVAQSIQKPTTQQQGRISLEPWSPNSGKGTWHGAVHGFTICRKLSSVTSLPTRKTKLYMRSQVQDQCLPAHMACDTPKVKCLSELTGAQLHLGSLPSAKSPLTGQTTTAPPLICRQTAPIQRGTPPSVSEPHTDKATATMPGESCMGGHAQERVSPYRGGRTPLYGRHCKFYAFIPSL